MAVSKNSLKGTLCVLAAGMCWGTTGTIQAFAPEGASSLTVGSARVVFSGIVLMLFMLAKRGRGLFAEVEALLAEGLSPGSTAMQAIGYKEAAEALRGECSRDEAIEKIKRETRRYAKRQLTWLRRREGALRIDWEGTPDFESALRASTGFCSAAV